MLRYSGQVLPFLVTLVNTLLTLCALLHHRVSADSLLKALQIGASAQQPSVRFELHPFSHFRALQEFVEAQKGQIDCLILEADETLPLYLEQLDAQSILLPTIILTSLELADADAALIPATSPYATVSLELSLSHLNQIQQRVTEAIHRFLQILNAAETVTQLPLDQMMRLTTHTSMNQKQGSLSEKLKERLGYLGVYYKRNSANFFRHMSQDERQELLNQLRADYRDIILNYFLNDPRLNEKLDNFVNQAFFADISVAQIVEIHMDLMDEFSKQLKLEGRSDEILLDYRLTLIDAIAHLCEMYRRSIPREP